MRKSLVISEQDNIAALLENDRTVEFFVNRGELLLGDIYTCTVENILPGIDAAFVNLGKDKMGFLHANDVPGQGPLKERLVPKQKLLVQITKEPTGHKGPRVSTAISLPGRFLVLVPEERGVSISRRISESRERARLKSVVNLMKPPGVGLIIRTEAKGQGEDELFDDFQQLWDTWQTIVSEAEASIGPLLIYRDQDLLYRVIRDAYSHEVTDIIVDSPDGQKRAQEYLSGWASKNTKVSFHTGEEPLLIAKSIDREIEAALSDRAELPSGGHLNIQPTEALTVIDVNSGRFTSSRTQAETVRRTNLEAAQEIPRQLRLRNIGGMVIVDFIDMESRKDQQQVLEVFQRALEEDRAKPQVGQLSDLGLVELTRRRQGQSLRELFTIECHHCTGLGVVTMLEVGPNDSRKVVGIRIQEEDSSGRRGSRKGGSAVLKSATAAGGRIVSQVAAEGDEADDVPAEILAQMPEDLLNDRDRMRRPRMDDQDFGEEEEEATVTEDLTVELRGDSISAKSSLYEESLLEDDEPILTSELDKNISAVEEVFQEISTSEPMPVEAQVLEVDEDDDDDEDEEEETWTPEPHVVAESPFEAVEGPVSGVFTLNRKPESESFTSPHYASESVEDQDEDEEEVHSHGHDHDHAHDHAHDLAHQHASSENQFQFPSEPSLDGKEDYLAQSDDSSEDDDDDEDTGENEQVHLHGQDVGSEQSFQHQDDTTGGYNNVHAAVTGGVTEEESEQLKIAAFTRETYGHAGGESDQSSSDYSERKDDQD